MAMCHTSVFNTTFVFTVILAYLIGGGSRIQDGDNGVYTNVKYTKTTCICLYVHYILNPSFCSLVSQKWGSEGGGGGCRDKIDLQDRSLGSALECVYTRGQTVGLLING